MSKQEFLARLRQGLSGLPQDDIEERLTFYSEMIDDRVEEGLSEEEAVVANGDVEEIVAQIIADTPLAKLVREKIRPKRKFGTWEILFLILGSPIWLSLLIAVFAVIISLYATLWSVIISLWAVEVSLWGCALGGILGGVIIGFVANKLPGIALAGAGIVCIGLSIFLFYGCKAATKGILLLTKRMALGTKNCFIRKGEA